MTAAQFNTRRKKPVDREGPVQRAIVRFLRTSLPGSIVHHAKGEINKSGVSIMREQAKAKANGALPGFPDLVVLPGDSWGVLFFEVKAPGGSVQKNQREMHENMTRLGYRVAVVRSVQDVRDSLSKWGIGWVEEIPMLGKIG